MNTLPRFLLLAAALLAVLTGCQSAAAPPPKSPPPPAATVTVPQAQPERVTQEDLESLKAYLRGDPPPERSAGSPQKVAIQMMCVVTGGFNVAPDGQSLDMETWCAGPDPGGSGTVLVQMQDTKAPREPGKHIFRIFFRNTTVSVQDLGGGQREVRLHYRVAGTTHHTTLPLRQGEKYAYSFSDLVPDPIEPLGETRVIEITR